MKRREDYELMAPAGSYESLTAAGQGGADAIYFGIEQLNMRARSSANFTADDLPQIVSKAAELGMRSYLTVNTVVYNHELIRMRKIIDLAVKHGVDAVIASDQSVLQYCNSAGARVHLSTQLNISNIETLKFYSGFADVAVLARELDLEQVKEITEGIKLEEINGPSGEPFRVEMFIHGALCMAISGKCYLSLHEHNHSANRGDCFQVCRRAYTVTDKEGDVELDIDNEYIMSPKDLKTIHFLNKVLDAGVSILKIEGRARSAEYVKTVVSCYDEAIGAYVDGSFTREKIEEWDKRLAKVFNRGFWDGYYLGQRLGEWSEKYGSKATHKKVYVGKGTNYFDRIGVVEVAIETGSLELGDQVVIIGPTTGVIETTIKELRVNEESCQSAGKGERCSFPVEQVVRRSDKVYKLAPRS
ncbi:MAG: U32 family peptidase [Bacteroidales bacterium]|nr:U32 family peptidase [Bacteroidales bacterium]